MESKLSDYIASKITTGSQLTIVVNRDGFLSKEDTRQAMFAVGIQLISGSGLGLRVTFELANWQADHVCLVIEQESDILPDIRENYPLLYFELYSDVLSRYDEEIIRKGLSFRQAEYLYIHKPNRILTAIQTQQEIRAAEAIYGLDMDRQKRFLSQLTPNWDKVETIKDVSKCLCEAFQHDSSDQIANEIAVINHHFQNYLDERYGTLKSANSLARPRIVSKILPFLDKKYERTDRVALVVVDGMSYWQYLILRPELERLGMALNDGFTFSWLPSITQLSRQAIFRGGIPNEAYSQNPTCEAKLWKDFWQSGSREYKKMLDEEIVYYYKGLPILDIFPNRLALVNVELDEYMHVSSHYSDLYSVTQNWSRRFANTIDELHRHGYHIYMTSDHGSILAQPWRSLKQDEKNVVLKTSRGSRHLIFEKPEYLDIFLNEHPELKQYLRIGAKYAIWKNNQCFRNDSEITHGGSHFMEVIVPFIEIEP